MASASKKLALRRLFEIEPVDIILLQETLGPTNLISDTLSSICLGWHFSALDSTGRSSGLVIGYKPKSIRLQASWGGRGFMGINLFSADLGYSLRVINIYGPCHQREHFWQYLLGLSIFSAEHIIIGGDLNFSLGYGESWGSMAQVDSIMGYMTDLLACHNLIDVPMNKPLPTWRNRRVGEAALAYRLDRFIMKETLLQQLHHYKQWVAAGGISDHSPIYLEIVRPTQKPKAPYKFNHVWLQDPSYIRMVSDYWVANPIDRSDSLAKGFCNNLSQLKHLSIKCARDKYHRDNSSLLHIESELYSLLDERGLAFATTEQKSCLVELESQKSQILKDREESLHLRSRAIWLKAGDDNTRFFHNYAKGKKVTNTIWSMPIPKGGEVDTFRKLSHLGSSHFRNLYKDPPSSTIIDIIQIAGNFPRFDKSPGPDGWTIEFYIAFYDLLSQDLLRVVDECCISGTLYNAINSTFIALIPKSDSPSSFNDYRPISLYNCLYKIIANRLRPILSRHIAPQQFAFLEHRQIHEAIGSAQETIHSIWTRHLKAITLKIDLEKAFDHVNWLFIKMLLIHLGFPHNFITWIMVCITTPTFSVLINGSASHFLHSKRGLRQGCPLSPLLFLIIMDGLSRLITSTKRDDDLCGLKISDDWFLTHLLFVDDVIIFLDGIIRDSRTFSKILTLFSSATGMLANNSKSTITFTRTSLHEAQFAHHLFPYRINPLD
eukprot:PITA_29832